MKKGAGWICLLMAVFATAGLLGGCTTGGQKEAAATAALSATTASPAYDAAEAAGTWVAAGRDSGFPAPGQKIGEDSRRPVHNMEEYRYYPENPFMSAADAPLSTFGADVDTASYANIRRMILDDDWVSEDAVRVEEMLDYFYYGYPEPKGGESFSATARLAQCPWNDKHDLLQIDLQAKRLDKGTMPKPNLVFLLDVSKSVEAPDKLDLVERAFLMMMEYLKSGDTIPIVTHASDDRIVLDGAAGEDRLSVMTAIENFLAGGSIRGSKGIETAYRLAERHYIEDGNSRAILAIDGDLNVGITGEGSLTRLIKDQRGRGVFLSVLGSGTGNLKDNKTEAMADNGNGQYSYVDSIAEARKVSMEEMGGTSFTVAKDVRFQVEPNPARIKGCRLTGYKNRVMADQDLEDDTKDGGEIEAGHRVTVLYELILADSRELTPETSLRYQAWPKEASQAPDTDTLPAYDGEWLTVKIRYKQPNRDGSGLLKYPVKNDSFHTQMSEDMVFTSCVAETGLLLKSSEYASDASYASVISRFQDLKRIKEDDYSNEFLYLIKRIAAVADQSR